MKSAVILLMSLAVACTSPDATEGSKIPEIQVYALDQFSKPDGLGSKLIPAFEKQCRCKVRITSVGDSKQLVLRLEEEAKAGNIKAHVVLGLDQYVFDRAERLIEAWERWVPMGSQAIRSELGLRPGFLPYGYTVLGFIANEDVLTKEKMTPPQELRDFLNRSYLGRIHLQDPRLSSSGLALLFYSKDVLGDRFDYFWKNVGIQKPMLVPGWDVAFALFQSGNSPFAWARVTLSQSESRFQEVIFKEGGHPALVEAGALVRNPRKTGFQSAMAKAFLEMLITKQSQEYLYPNYGMLPAIDSVTVPVKIPNIRWPTWVVRSDQEELIRRWEADFFPDQS